MDIISYSKAVKVEKEVNDLKSAFNYSDKIRCKLYGVENALDRINLDSGSQRGISYDYTGGGVYYVHGTVLSGQTYSQLNTQTSHMSTGGEARHYKAMMQEK